MKKMLIVMTALLLMSVAVQAESRVFGGANYVGSNWGVVFGYEQSITSKFTVTPWGRYSIDSTLTNEGIRFQKSTGIETMVWLFGQGEWRFGLTASPVTIDWLDGVEKDIGTYFSGSGGVAVDWKGKDLGFRAWMKVKTDFKSASSYEDLSEIGFIAVINQFW